MTFTLPTDISSSSLFVKPLSAVCLGFCRVSSFRARVWSCLCHVRLYVYGENRTREPQSMQHVTSGWQLKPLLFQSWAPEVEFSISVLQYFYFIICLYCSSHWATSFEFGCCCYLYFHFRWYWIVACLLFWMIVSCTVQFPAWLLSKYVLNKDISLIYYYSRRIFDILWPKLYRRDDWCHCASVWIFLASR